MLTYFFRGLFLFSLFAIAACCTKKGCLCDNDELLLLQLDTGYNVQEHPFSLIITEKENYAARIDSVKLPVSAPCNSCTFRYYDIDIRTYTIGKLEWKNYSYIIKNDFYQIADTINNVTYEYVHSTSKCNSCLFGSDNITCRYFSNYLITINGKQYEGQHPDIVIH